MPKSYLEFRELARNEAEKGLMKSLKAPSKRGWSKLTGQSIPSKNDVLRATNTNVRNICSTAGELFPDEPSLIMEEEDVEPVKLT